MSHMTVGGRHQLCKFFSIVKHDPFPPPAIAFRRTNCFPDVLVLGPWNLIAWTHICFARAICSPYKIRKSYSLLCRRGMHPGLWQTHLLDYSWILPICLDIAALGPSCKEEQHTSSQGLLCFVLRYMVKRLTLVSLLLMAGPRFDGFGWIKNGDSWIIFFICSTKWYPWQQQSTEYGLVIHN